MKNLITFVSLTLFIMFVVLACSKPELHKHFIIEPSGFQLESLGQQPKDLQSVNLFKIGDVPQEVHIINEQKKVIKTDPEVKIIPTAFIDSKFASMNSETSVPSTSNGNAVVQNNETLSQNTNQPIDNNEEVLKQVAEMIGEKGGLFGFGKPNRADNPQYRLELIAWNEWRSNLQNTIMQKSDIEGMYGTIYFFIFNVDDSRRISDVKVRSNVSDDRYNIDKVTRTIKDLEGSDILEFPQGTTRTSVRFTGGFMFAYHTRYSSPSDFNDVEQVNVRYR